MADKPSRRLFLGSAIAAGAGIALARGDSVGPARLDWCMRPAFPMAPRTVWLLGGLEPGQRADLSLWVEGPGFEEPLRLGSTEVVLRAKAFAWEVELDYRHPRLIAGRYRYVARARIGSAEIESRAVAYDVSPFSFGA